MKEKNFKQKGFLIIKYMLIWAMVMGIRIINASKAFGENFSLLIVDFKMGFSDNPLLWQQIKNKLSLLSVFFIVLIILTLFTEDFRLGLRLGKWRIELDPNSGGLRWGSTFGVTVVAVWFLWMSIGFLEPQMRQAVRGGWEDDLFVAHACGGIEGLNYTNSVEAFEHSYQEGIRVMEIDFQLTSDDRLVCVHEWDAQMDSDNEEEYVCSEEEFLNSQIYDQFTPMSLEMLFELMREYEDTWIITDTKDADWASITQKFRVFVETAEETDSRDLLDRFVVQLYNYDMYDAVERIYSFPSYILTLYILDNAEEGRFVEYCRFCRNRNIDRITMWDYWVTPRLIAIAQEYGIDIYVHTVNDLDEMERLRDMGIKGFYTDYLTPRQVEGKG